MITIPVNDRRTGHLNTSDTNEDLKPKYAAQRQWDADHPKQRWAQNALRSALKKGLITQEPCQVCGDPDTDAHHPDYDRPMAVEWLCRKHHRQAHRKPKAGADVAAAQ